MNPDTLRDNLATQLAARSGIQAISGQVFRYAPGNRATIGPILFFDEVTASLDSLSLAGGSDGTWTLTGYVLGFSAGATDDNYGAAEQTARTLLNELYDQLDADPTVNGACSYARVVGWSGLRIYEDDGGRLAAETEFTIEVRDFAD